jgi:hypothetical protein
MVLFLYNNDMNTTKEVQISTMTTKIKITVKTYNLVKKGRNVRVGFSPRSKSKIRLYGNLKNPTIKQLVNTEVYEIRKNDS